LALLPARLLTQLRSPLGPSDLGCRRSDQARHSNLWRAGLCV